MDKLEVIFNTQRKLQERLDPEILTDVKKLRDGGPEGHAKLADNIKKHALALMMEAAELLDFVPWKHWSKRAGNKHPVAEPLFNDDHMREIHLEIVDGLHFLVNCALASGMTAEDMFRIYAEKNKINYERQESGTY